MLTERGVLVGRKLVRYAGKGGKVCMDKGAVGGICELEPHYESYTEINNTPNKQQQSPLQGGSDRD